MANRVVQVHAQHFNFHAVSQTIVGKAPHKHLYFVGGLQGPDMLPIKFDSAVSRIFLRAWSISSQPSIAQHNTNLISRLDGEDAMPIKMPSKIILHPLANANGENAFASSS